MNDLRVINLSSYTTPKVVEYKNKEWIGYGDDNNYFKYLIDRYNGSPTNNAIINAISAMIFGKGLDATDSSRKPEEYAKMVSLFNNDCIRKLCYDLKLMGQCSIQIIYSKDRKTIAQIEHFPVETLRAEKSGEDGEINAYYYFHDWAEYKPQSKLKRIPAFSKSNESIEILYIKPYRAGYHYYSPVDYQGGLQYAELEEEVGNFHLNNIMNGMSPSMLINFNNGVPNEEERELIEQRISQKFSGSSNAGKFILAFNDNAETAASIDPVQLSDAHQQYQFLSEESTRKIMVAHRIVSPMLIGIKDQSGLGNNADELKTASILLDNTVIRPFQHLLIDCFDKILAYNKISLNLYFKTLQPLEFTDLENVEDEETKEEETGVKLSEEACCVSLGSDLDKYIDNDVADALIDLGEDENELLEKYDLIDEFEVDYETENELDHKISELNEKTELANTGSAKPYRDSKQDGKSKKKGQEDVIFLVRYMYTPYSAGYKTRKGKSREFCIKMMNAKKVYRKEDIKAMDNKVVNAGFGKNGASTYSIWLYKGGARCSHRWTRRIYARKEGNKSLGNTVSTNQAINKGFRPEKNAKKVSIAPRNMANKGYTSAYWNKMGFKN
tara:strand:- start:14870 stop:16705 length:1836 start_codon:yes stop_codon:yes gene_type:complete